MKKTVRVILIICCIVVMVISSFKIAECLDTTTNSDLVELKVPVNNIADLDNNAVTTAPAENAIVPPPRNEVVVDSIIDNENAEDTENTENTENDNNDTTENTDNNVVEEDTTEEPVVTPPVVVTKPDLNTYTDSWKEYNKDVTATITIENLENEPIVTTPNNQNEYLRKDIFGKYSVSGTLFTAYDSVLGKTNVTTVFGHSMKNGSMFGTLKNYKDLSYLKKNPTFTMSSETANYTLKIVGVAEVSSNYSDMGWCYVQSNLSEKQFEKFEKEVRTRSRFVIPDKFDYESKYVILSCCAYAFSGERLIIVARIMDENETVDTSTYAKNSLILRANEFYKTYNTTKPSQDAIDANYKKNYK